MVDAPQVPAHLWAQAPVGWVTTDVDWTILAVNETLLGWIDRPREEVVGAHFAELLTAAGRIWHETHHAPLVLHSGHASEVAAALDHGAEPVPVLLESLRTQDPDGTDVVQTAVIRVSERRRYEQELLLSRRRAESVAARLQLVHDATADLVGADSVPEVAGALADAVHRVRGAQHAVTWLVDESGSSLQEVTAAGRGQRHLPLRAEHPTARAVLMGELVVDTRAGIVAAPLGRATGVLGVLEVVLDVEDGAGLPAEQRDVIETLADLAGAAVGRAMLRQRGDEVAGAAAHDLRTPLGVVLGHAAALEEALEDRLTTSEAAVLARIRTTTAQMHDLMEGFVALTALEQGTDALDVAPRLVGDLVREAVADVEGALGQAAVTVRVLDRCDGAAVRVDADHGPRAVRLLLLEALDAAARTTTLSVRIDATLDEVRIQVAEPRTDRAEARWVESSSSDEAPSLALAVVRGLVGAHGGTLTRTDSVDETTHEIVLPRA